MPQVWHCYWFLWRLIIDDGSGQFENSAILPGYHIFTNVFAVADLDFNGELTSYLQEGMKNLLSLCSPIMAQDGSLTLSHCNWLLEEKQCQLPRAGWYGRWWLRWYNSWGYTINYNWWWCQHSITPDCCIAPRARSTCTWDINQVIATNCKRKKLCAEIHVGLLCEMCINNNDHFNSSKGRCAKIYPPSCVHSALDSFCLHSDLSAVYKATIVILPHPRESESSNKGQDIGRIASSNNAFF